MSTTKTRRVHPGEVLVGEFLLPLGLSQYRLAKDISVSARRINEIVHGKRAITADTALRLARYFGTSDRFWLNLQARHDLEVERDRLGHRLEEEVAILAESYAPESRARFLLENAVDADDYDGARAAVRAMGLDPDTIEHSAPRDRD